MDQKLDRLFFELGINLDDLNEVRGEQSWHWADVDQPIPPGLAARVIAQGPVVAAELTNLGHAEGWLPTDLKVSCDLDVL